MIDSVYKRKKRERKRETETPEPKYIKLGFLMAKTLMVNIIQAGEMEMGQYSDLYTNIAHTNK